MLASWRLAVFHYLVKAHCSQPLHLLTQEAGTYRGKGLLVQPSEARKSGKKMISSRLVTGKDRIKWRRRSWFLFLVDENRLSFVDQLLDVAGIDLGACGLRHCHCEGLLQAKWLEVGWTGVLGVKAAVDWGLLVQTGSTKLASGPAGILSLDGDNHLITLGKVDAADGPHFIRVRLKYDLLHAGHVLYSGGLSGLVGAGAG